MANLQSFGKGPIDAFPCSTLNQINDLGVSRFPVPCFTMVDASLYLEVLGDTWNPWFVVLG